MSDWLFGRLTGDAYLMAFEKRAAERQQKGEAAIEEARGKIQAARDKVRPLAAILVAALHAESYTGGSTGGSAARR